MRPFDPRLLRYAHSARRHIITISVIGFLTAALVIAQALVISTAVSPVITGHATLNDVWHWVLILLGIVAFRGGLVALREALGHRAAEQAIGELREALVRKAEALGPRWRARNGAETATLISRGLDDLAPYFVKFLPQLVLVSTVTPLALATILLLDFWSALIAALTIPLIPIFMVLIGRFTQDSTSIKLAAMERLGAQLLDLMSGLPTLRALGREKGPNAHLKELGEANTTATMATLRIAFLSGGALEFLATLSVALVAVEVGMRLVGGSVTLVTGLAVIMLAPEVFEPLRQVGAQFHASANGVAAANAAFAILEQDEAPRGTTPAPRLTTCRIECDNLSVAARGAWAPRNLQATIEPGTIVALQGDSGAGKTTTAMCLLGLERPTEGRILLHSPEGSIDLDDCAPESFWEQVIWIPQSPTLIAGTLRDNLPAASDDELAQAARMTTFDEVLATLPKGWETPIGSGGLGLSVGQRQRLALMEAFLTRAPLVVLDEPTAHLDALSEESVTRAVAALKEAGSTVVVIAHRKAMLDLADQVIPVRRSTASIDDIERYPILTPVDTLDSLEVTLPTFLDDALLEDTAPQEER
ncbi:thiol reductant ABC exporter subunit CydD [Schaalia canis]|uniref:Thiol reductant ABC exporter subunit CydD n=1 Tax=Schaalia canis TaxID=100469 RepID=A0A3P1SGS1_9ACTO|nr:thiol reductant ABC exporter subunit CydD [Schaalia canis]RRC96358.1 thiol reductant ABC exporter subunit CydD [Schaalia canis]